MHIQFTCLYQRINVKLVQYQFDVLDAHHTFIDNYQSNLIRYYNDYDCLLFYIPLKNISLIWRRHHYRWRAAKFRPMLVTQGLWAGRDLYRATPAVIRGLGFSGLIETRISVYLMDAPLIASNNWITSWIICTKPSLKDYMIYKVILSVTFV